MGERLKGIGEFMSGQVRERRIVRALELPGEQGVEGVE